MLLVVEQPTVDVRRMLGVSTAMTTAPDWTWMPGHGDDFVRGLGPVKERPGGGVEPWPGEGFFVQCRGSVRLDPAALRTGGSGIGLHPVFRRYFADGQVGRLEVGFRTTAARSGALGSGVEPASAALAALAVPARLPRAAGPRLLSELGADFAAYLLQATTLTRPHASRRAPKIEHWWVSAGAPLVLCEVRHDELGERDGDAVAGVSAELVARAPGSAYVEQRWQTVGKQRVSMWYLMFGPNADPESVRRLRIHITRLHAEHVALRTVLRLCDKGRLDPAASQSVRDYIDERTGILLRKDFAGCPQRQLLELVLDRWERSYVDDLTTMRAVERKLASKGLQRRVEAVKLLGDPGTPPAGAPGTPNNFYITGGTVTISDHSVEISHVTGNVAGVQGGSGNELKVDAIHQTSTNIIELAAGLVAAVEALRGELSDQELAEGSDSATAIQDEAAKPQPDKGKIRRFLGKLVEWGKKVGPPALAVATAAAQIAAVL
jgi:hypothetical protein